MEKLTKIHSLLSIWEKMWENTLKFKIFSSFWEYILCKKNRKFTFFFSSTRKRMWIFHQIDWKCAFLINSIENVDCSINGNVHFFVECENVHFRRHAIDENTKNSVILLYLQGKRAEHWWSVSIFAYFLNILLLFAGSFNKNN